MPKKNKGKIKKILKLQFLFTIIIIFLYSFLGYVAGRGILFSDIQQKGRVAGATVFAVVRAFGPPSTPSVTATPSCTSQRNAYINLSWGLDQEATEYDVYRDGAELMLGLTENSFDDLSVVDDASYSYYVVAKGPKGTATSDDVATTATKCPSVANPEVTVTTFQGRDVSHLGSVPGTTKRRPLFQGQTNIPSADIELEIHDSQNIYATTQANSNGYWQWSPAVNLSYRSHTLYVSAIDPNDPSVTASTSFAFKIKRDETEDSGGGEEEQTAVTPPAVSYPPASSVPAMPPGESSTPNEPPGETQKPVDFEMEFGNIAYIKGVSMSDVAYRGENLEVKISFTEAAQENQQVSLKYTLYSLDQKILAEYVDNVKIGVGREITKRIPLSYDLEPGKYKLQISAAIGSTTVSHENYFILEDRPVLQIGSAYISYADIVSHTGWLLFICLFILIILCAAAIWEHHLTQRAILQITEKVLKKKGFIN